MQPSAGSGPRGSKSWPPPSCSAPPGAGHCGVALLAPSAWEQQLSLRAALAAVHGVRSCKVQHACTGGGSLYGHVDMTQHTCV